MPSNPNDNEVESQSDLLRLFDEETLKRLRPLIESGLVRISETISNFIEFHFGGPEQFFETLLEIEANAARYVEAIPAMEKRLKAAEKSNYEGLLDYSWYIDPEMNAQQFFDLSDLVEQKDENSINDTLVAHFRTRLDAIEEELNTRHTGRTRILAKAFKSHREGIYALAIPVFLAQADGISRELIGAEYFVTRKSKNLVDSLLQEVTGDMFLEAALRTLRPTGAIRISTLEKRNGSFNRHAVMHGSDLDYDSELNSLKAVSLINFMSRMFQSKQDHLMSRAHKLTISPS